MPSIIHIKFFSFQTNQQILFCRLYIDKKIFKKHYICLLAHEKNEKMDKKRITLKKIYIDNWKKETKKWNKKK